MRVIFIGQNPSKHNLDQNIPFLGTKSERILLNWLKKMSIDYAHCIFMNVSNKPGKLKVSDYNLDALKLLINHHKNVPVIALGNIASDVLNRINVKHFKLPHPSGKNRKLNDKTFINIELLKCKEYIIYGEYAVYHRIM